MGASYRLGFPRHKVILSDPNRWLAVRATVYRSRKLWKRQSNSQEETFIVPWWVGKIAGTSCVFLLLFFVTNQRDLRFAISNRLKTAVVTIFWNYTTLFKTLRALRRCLKLFYRKRKKHVFAYFRRRIRILAALGNPRKSQKFWATLTPLPSKFARAYWAFGRGEIPTHRTGALSYPRGKGGEPADCGRVERVEYVACRAAPSSFQTPGWVGQSVEHSCGARLPTYHKAGARRATAALSLRCLSVELTQNLLILSWRSLATGSEVRSLNMNLPPSTHCCPVTRELRVSGIHLKIFLTINNNFKELKLIFIIFNYLKLIRIFRHNVQYHNDRSKQKYKKTF